jgi:nitrogen fixation protein FixH
MRIRMALATAAVSLFSPLLLAGTAQAATPVAIWHMENATNQVMTDSSGSGNNGSTSSGISVVSGYSGAGYRFASNGFVTVPDSAGLNPGSEDFSFSMYVNFPKAPPAGGDFDVIRKGLATTSGGEWKMEIFGNSALSSPAFCLFKGSTAASAVTVRGTTNLAGAWHEITCTKTSTQVSVAVDGVVQRTNKTAVGSISNTADVSIGRKLGGGDQYIGVMDEVTIEKGAASSGDIVAPTLTAKSPTGSTVPLDTTVTATFSEPVQGVDESTFTLSSTGGGTVTATVVQGTNNQWILTPASPLTAGVTYTAALSNAIHDPSGNAFGGTSWTFTTAPPPDSTPPTVTAHTPTATTGVSRTANITATFSETVTNVTQLTFQLTPTGGGLPVPATVTFNSTNGRWVLNPVDTLAASTPYTATVAGGADGVKDLAGNLLDTTANASWSFTTGLT